jgi:hypothetical protein
MKLLSIITISFFLFTANIYGNDYEAPGSVKAMFAKMYPEVENVLWEKWNEEVVAIFKDWEGLKKVFFTEKGVWVETRKKLKVDQLPQYIQTILYENYPDMEVTYAGKVYRAQEILFQVESESDEAVIVKLFEENGQLISEETIRFSTSGLELLPMLPNRKTTIKTTLKSLEGNSN